MEALLPIIIQVISGVVGGGVTGQLVKTASMALLPKLLAGGVGGLGGGAALGPVIAGMLGDGGGAALLGDAVGGLVGGGALTGIAGAVMGAMKK